MIFGIDGLGRGRLGTDRASFEVGLGVGDIRVLGYCHGQRSAVVVPGEIDFLLALIRGNHRSHDRIVFLRH
ncbi:hypothetical protein D3C81_2099910 [compost metagenome]